MATLLTSYSESNYSGYDDYLYTGLVDSVGESFQISGNYNLTSAKFYIRRNGTAGSDIVAKLYATTGTFPTSAKPTDRTYLAVSDSVSYTSISSSFSLVEFTFSGVNQYTMIGGVTYFIAIEYIGGNSSNKVYVGNDGTSPSYNGNKGQLNYLSNSWSSTTSQDICFYVYGDLAVIPTNFQINIADTFKTVESMQINIADTWKDVTGASINIGDSWRTIF